MSLELRLLFDHAEPGAYGGCPVAVLSPALFGWTLAAA